jgi:hypothetical protein
MDTYRCRAGIEKIRALWNYKLPVVPGRDRADGCLKSRNIVSYSIASSTKHIYG